MLLFVIESDFNHFKVISWFNSNHKGMRVCKLLWGRLAHLIIHGKRALQNLKDNLELTFFCTNSIKNSLLSIILQSQCQILHFVFLVQDLQITLNINCVNILRVMINSCCFLPLENLPRKPLLKETVYFGCRDLISIYMNVTLGETGQRNGRVNIVHY